MSGRKYLAIAGNEARTVFTYRGSLGAFLFGSILLIALQYLIWRNVFSGTVERGGVTFPQVVLYSILARLWVFILPGFRVAAEFEQRVRDGSVVRDLLYPMSFAGMWLAKAAGRSAGWFLFVSLPLLAAGLVWLRPNVEPATLLLGVVSAVCGYLIAFTMAGFVGLSTLFLRRSDGLNELRDALNSVLGGSLIPLVFYPATVAGVVKFLPFVQVYYVPISLLSGMDTVGWQDVALGGVWAAGLLGALAMAVTAARSRLVLDGG